LQSDCFAHTEGGAALARPEEAGALAGIDPVPVTEGDAESDRPLLPLGKSRLEAVELVTVVPPTLPEPSTVDEHPATTNSTTGNSPTSHRVRPVSRVIVRLPAQPRRRPGWSDPRASPRAAPRPARRVQG